MQKNYILILAVSISLLLLAGKCENGSGTMAEGKLLNLKGLSGCGWVIELDDGTRLEPINLAGFENSPQEGMEVVIWYQEEKEMASTCMVGPIITILKYKKKEK